MHIFDIVTSEEFFLGTVGMARTVNVTALSNLGYC